MKRALHAGAAALAFSVAACASDDDAAVGARDAEADASGAAARDASAGGGASGSTDADATADGGADRDADAGDMSPMSGPDYLRSDAVRPSPQGVVRVAFDAPADARSFVVTVDPGASPRVVQLLEVRGPDGLLWSALDDGPHPFEPLALRNVNDFVPYAVMLPSAPELPLTAGRYEVALRAGTDDEHEVSADVVVKRAADAPASGTLAVALWFVPGAGLDAQDAGDDARLQDALARFADIYGAAGVELALAPPRDLPAAAAELVVLDEDADTAELLALLAAEDAGATERALHVVFVARIDAAGRTVRGKSSGLPGPPAHPALSRRGAVIVGVETLPPTPERIGELLAHEAAHFLGLRHSSEFDGVRHDPLADTPECPAERASQTTSDGMPLLSAEDCDDLDGANLLFYTPPQDEQTAQDELSADQAFVLLHSPLVR